MKRLFSALLAFIFVFSTPVVGHAATDLLGHWARPQMEAFMGRGLIQGFPDGTVRPDHPITRAEFYTLANRAFGFSQVAPINFIDVSSGAWYFTEISRAQAAGYILGGMEAFPNRHVTREEAAMITSRILGLAPFEAGAAQFADNHTIENRPYVGAVALAGLMRGFPDGTFRPHATITRAEAVAVLTGAMGRVGINLPGVSQAQQTPLMQLESAIPASVFGQDLSPGWPPSQPWNQGPVWGPTGPNQGPGPWTPGPGWPGWNQGPGWGPGQGERLTVRVVNDYNGEAVRDAYVEISAMNFNVRRTIVSARTNSSGEISFWLPSGLLGGDLVRIIVSASGFNGETREIRVSNLQRTTIFWLLPSGGGTGGGGGGTTPTFVPVTNITGVPTTATAGTPLVLTGTVVPSNATNQTISWAISSAGTSTGASTSVNTLNPGTSAGTLTLRATITNGLTATTPYIQYFPITINLPGGGGVTPPSAPTGVTVTAAGNAATVIQGGTLQFNAVVAPATALQDVNWTVAPSPAGVSINANGLLSVASTVSDGTSLTITATTTAPGASFSDSATVTVAAPAGLTLSPTSITIDDTNTSQTTNVTGMSGIIAYSTSTLPAGFIVTVNQGTGVVTVSHPRPLPGGTAVIGTYTLDITRGGETETLTIDVNITPLAAGSLNINITPNLANMVIQPGTTLQFSAAVLPAGAPQNVIWSVAGDPGAAINPTTGLLDVASTVPRGTTLTVTAALGAASSDVDIETFMPVVWFDGIPPLSSGTLTAVSGTNLTLPTMVELADGTIEPRVFNWGFVTAVPWANIVGGNVLTTTGTGTLQIRPTPPLPDSIIINATFSPGVSPTWGTVGAWGSSFSVTVNPASPGPVAGVHTTPNVNQTIGVGDTLPITAIITPASALNQTVVWSSTNNSVATVTSTGSNAALGQNFANIVGVSPGTVTIGVTTDDGSFTAQIQVTVTSGPAVTSVRVTPPALAASPGTQVDVQVGGTQQFSAHLTYVNNPAPLTVTWTVTGGIAGTSINPTTGLLTIAPGETASTLTVRATSNHTPAVWGESVVNVTPPATVTGVTVTPNPVNVPIGGTQTFTAVVTGTNNPPQTVTWGVSGQASAGTTINTTTGELTVAANETATTLTITAASTHTPAQNGTAMVNVTLVPVTHITPVFNMAKQSGVDHDLSFNMVHPSNATNSTIVWSVVSSAGATATNATITGSILQTNAGTSGTVTVRAAIADGLALSTPFTQDFIIEVVDAAPIFVTGVTITGGNRTIAVNGTVSLAPSLTFAPPTASNRHVTWSSSDVGIANVFPNGNVIGVSAGTATITARTVCGGHTATIQVVVNP
ncbi:MAG: Ig-like domain-containing protein [Defluviitaleaceae bacterium]|nr:Ig-like domain-containing protein [Defluviitaleaceae bacterium]